MSQNVQVDDTIPYPPQTTRSQNFQATGPANVEHKAFALHRQNAGPSETNYDLLTYRRWVLLSGGGFVTWPHYDAAGFCTWTLLTCGAKLWGYVLPKKEGITTSEASKIYLEMAQAMDLYYGSPETDVPHLADIFNLLLTPGTLL